MGFLDSLFSSSKDSTEQTKSTQEGKSTTESNLWDQIQPFFQQYQQQYGNFNGADTPINAFQTGAAEGQSGVAGSLTGAGNTAAGIANNGITTENIQKYMDPYIASVVNPTLAAQKIQNDQAVSGLRGNQAVRGALGNNTGSEAAYYAGVQPGQQAQIGSLYSAGWDKAGQLSTADVNARLQGVQGQAQVAGAQTGANTAAGGLGQNIWDSTYKNNLTPYELANQGVTGLGNLGGLAGQTTNTKGTATGTSTGTQTATPSIGGIISGLAGTALTAFAPVPKAEGGRIEGYAGGGEVSPLPSSTDKNGNGIADNLEGKVGRYFDLFTGLRKKAAGGAVEEIEPLDGMAGGGDVGLGSWMPTVTLEPAATGPSSLQRFGSGLSDISKGMEDDSAPMHSSLGEQQQGLSSFLGSMGHADGGEVGEEELTPFSYGHGLADSDALTHYGDPEADPEAAIDSPEAISAFAPTREVEGVPSSGYVTPLEKYAPASAPVQSGPPAESGGFWSNLGLSAPFSSGVWKGEQMSPMQRLGAALTQVGDSPFAGFGKSLQDSEDAGFRERQAKVAAGERATALERQDRALKQQADYHNASLQQALALANRPKFQQIGENEWGQKEYGAIDPVTGLPIKQASVEGGAGEKVAADAPATMNDLVDGYESGKLPPDLKGLYKKGAAVRAQLAKRGFDVSAAQNEWAAAQKQISALNGPQMVKYAGLAHSVINTIDEVNSLAKEMENSGVPILNKAKIQTYINTAGNSEKGMLAARYMGAVNTLQEEFANLAQGGYAPTEAAWHLANQQINANYGVKQMGAALGEVQRLIRYRLQGIPNFEKLGPGAANRYTGKQAVEEIGHETPQPNDPAAVSAPAAPAVPARPANVPPGSAYSPKMKAWKTPEGAVFDESGKPVP